MAAGKTVAATDISARTIRRVRNRLIPLLFLLYVVAFLDRTNISFAALTMNADLAITSAQYGLLTGIFFWGYFLFEIPSNLLLHRIGARTWIARILVTFWRKNHSEANSIGWLAAANREDGKSPDEVDSPGL